MDKIPTNDDLGKALVRLVNDSLAKLEGKKLRLALRDRMTPSESIEAATKIVGCYPNGGREAGKSYLGALAAILATYPKCVARQCADQTKGITIECKFLPTVADIVAWCEKETAPLYRQVEYENRVEEQLAGREDPAMREGRLDYLGLKRKYGDWHNGWQTLGLAAQKAKEAAERDLRAQIGDEAFDALPDGPQAPMPQ